MYFSQWPFCHLNFQDNQEHNVPQSSFLVGKGTGKILQDHTTKVVKTSCYLTGSESTGDGYITQNIAGNTTRLRQNPVQDWVGLCGYTLLVGVYLGVHFKGGT